MSVLKIGDPVCGVVQQKIEGPSSYMEWAPGNGYVCRAVFSPVDGFEDFIGNSVMVSFQVDGGATYASFPVSSYGFFHLSYVREKVGPFFGANEKMLRCYTALLNWALGDEAAKYYAKEIYETAL